MTANMMLDALIVDIEPPANVQPVQEYVWLRDPATGEQVCVRSELENIIAIFMSVGYRMFVPSDRGSQ
jgi:hypothetical protein